MNLYTGTIVDVDTENLEILVQLDHNGATVNVVSLYRMPPHKYIAGDIAIPHSDSKCLLFEQNNKYYYLGMYLPSSGATVNGFEPHPDIKLPPLTPGDYLQKHKAGNYILMGANGWHNIQGTYAVMSLVGGLKSAFRLSAKQINIDNGAGSLIWSQFSNTKPEDYPSAFILDIKKNFEQNAIASPSDFVKISAGSIMQGEGFANHVFQIETAQYSGPTVNLYSRLTLSRDDEDNDFSLLTYNSLTNDELSIRAYQTSNLKIDLTKSLRNVSISFLDSQELLNANFDDKVKIAIQNSGKSFFTLKNDVEIDITNNLDLTVNDTYTVNCSNIRFGDSSAQEPIVLGNVLKDLLTTLIDIITNSKHLHPMGPTTGLFPSDIIKLTQLKSKLYTMLSNIAKIKE